MERIPEPELMDAPEQAEAYAHADFSDANGRFVEEFLARFGHRPASGELIDLGCGPGDICLRLARALPGWKISGIDAGPNMLRLARVALDGAGLGDRVEFRFSHLPDPGLAAGRYDAVVSNSLLHHLPDPAILWKTASRIARPGAYVQVMDLERPPSEEAALTLVERYAAGEPEILRRDFHNSLKAAWRAEEVSGQLRQAGLEVLAVEAISDRHWLVSGFIP